MESLVNHNVFKRFDERFKTLGGSDFPRELDDKLEAYKFADKYKIRRPEIYGIFKSIESFENALDLLPNRIVIKPNGFSSGKGVFLLERVDNVFFNYLTSNNITKNEIVNSIRSLFGTSKNPLIDESIIVEEFIEPAINASIIPMDYKILTHFGRVFEIIQINRNTTPVSHAFFDENFIPKGWNDDHNFQGIRAPHIIPAHASEMLEYTKKLTKEIASPFVRIDFYDGKKGAYLGEFTPAPGNFTIKNGVNITSYPYKKHALDLFEERWVDAVDMIEKSEAKIPKISKSTLDENILYFKNNIPDEIVNIKKYNIPHEIGMLQVRALQNDSSAALKLSSIYLEQYEDLNHNLIISLGWAKISSLAPRPQLFSFERISNLIKRCKKNGYTISLCEDIALNDAIRNYEIIENKTEWINFRLAGLYLSRNSDCIDIKNKSWAIDFLKDISEHNPAAQKMLSYHLDLDL